MLNDKTRCARPEGSRPPLVRGTLRACNEPLSQAEPLGFKILASRALPNPLPNLNQMTLANANTTLVARRQAISEK